jgi:flagellar basal-body rod modification protein FlgD
MATTPIDSSALLEKYGYLPGAQAKAAADKENLFLTILTTQLKNQDPLAPLEDGEFVQQISGMASLQEQQTLNQQLSSMIQLQQIVAGQNAFTQSASLVGKYVTYVDPETQEKKSGLVSEVKLDGGALSLKVGDQEVAMGNIVGLSATAPDADDAPESTEEDNV